MIGFTKMKNLSDYNALNTLENKKKTSKEKKHVSTQNIKHCVVSEKMLHVSGFLVNVIAKMLLIKSFFCNINCFSHNT